jgi:hypothetical protein
MAGDALAPCVCSISSRGFLLAWPRVKELSIAARASSPRAPPCGSPSVPLSSPHPAEALPWPRPCCSPVLAARAPSPWRSMPSHLAQACFSPALLVSRAQLTPSSCARTADQLPARAALCTRLVLAPGSHGVLCSLHAARSEASACRDLPSSPWLPDESLPSLLVLFELGSYARSRAPLCLCCAQPRFLPARALKSLCAQLPPARRSSFSVGVAPMPVLARGRAQSPSSASTLFLLLRACSSVFPARPTGVFLRAPFSQLRFRQPSLSYPRQHATVVVSIKFPNALLSIRSSSLLRASLRARV